MSKQPEVAMIDEAARMLGVSRPTIYDWIGKGKLEEVIPRGGERKDGRYRLVTVESVERLKAEREGRDV